MAHKYRVEHSGTRALLTAEPNKADQHIQLDSSWSMFLQPNGEIKIKHVFFHPNTTEALTAAPVGGGFADVFFWGGRPDTMRFERPVSQHDVLVGVASH